MRVGFDFDKVFIDYPPFVPNFVIDLLYKGSSFFNNKEVKENFLHYRIPGKLEKKLRILSHHPILRHPIGKNLRSLKAYSNLKSNRMYLVSSRFSFLKPRTDSIIKKYSLQKYFDGIYFNYENSQPHIFKEKTIRKLKIDAYVDDDLQLALYLSKKIPELKIYWITNNPSYAKTLPKNVKPIKDLTELKDSLFHE